MKIFKKVISMLMTMLIIITPLIPSKVFANSIYYPMPVLDSKMGSIYVGFYYDSVIPSSTKNIAIGVDVTLKAKLDQSILSDAGNLVNNYLTNSNYLVSKNLPIQGEDTIRVVIRDLPGSTKGQLVPDVITENGLNILYMDIDMFKIGADPKLAAGTIIHELQHLVNYAYDHNENYSNLNEGLSSYFEADFYQTVGANYYTTDKEYQFTNVESNQYDKSLYRVDSYGKSKLFVDYLISQSGIGVIDLLITQAGRPTRTELKEIEFATGKTMAELFEGFVNFIQDKVAIQNRGNIVENNIQLIENNPYYSTPTDVYPFTFYTKYYRATETGKLNYESPTQQHKVLIRTIRDGRNIHNITLSAEDISKEFTVEYGDIISITPLHTVATINPWDYTPVGYFYNLTLIPNQAPLITLTGQEEINIVKGGNYVEPGYVATDVEDGDLTSSVVVTGFVDTAAVGTYTLTYKVTDSGGKETTITRTVNVTEHPNTPPQINLIGESSITIEKGNPYVEPGYDAIDTEDVDLTSEVIVSGTVDNSTVGTYTLTYSVTDTGGLTATATRIVTVVDNTPNAPTIIDLAVGTHLTFPKGTPYIEPGYTAEDLEDGDLTDSVIVTGTVDSSTAGIYVLTYTVTDSGGLTTSVTRTITIEDTIPNPMSPPIITVHGDKNITVEVNTNYSSPAVTAVDEFGNDVTLSMEKLSNVNINVVGEYVETFTAWNSHYINSATETITVNVVDTTDPIINLINDTIDVSIGDIVDLMYGVTISDNYTPSNEIQIDINPTSLDTTTAGAFTVTYKATDSSGNYKETFRTYNIVDESVTPPDPIDTVKPIVQLSYNIIIVAKGENVALPTVNVIDTDTNVEILQTGTYDNMVAGTYTIVYTAKDSSGNISDPVTFTIIVTEPQVEPEEDTIPPVINTNSELVLNVVKGEPFVYPIVTATDNKDNPIYAVRTGNIDTNVVGTQTISYKAVDSAGNESNIITFTVNVVEPSPTLDIVKPVLTITGGNSRTITRGTAFTLPTATAIDNVDGNITNKISKTGTFNVDVVGNYPITYEVADNAGNETTVIFTLTVTATQSSGGGGRGGGGSTSTPKAPENTVAQPPVPPAPPTPPPSVLTPLNRVTITIGSNIVNIEGRNPIIMDVEPFVDNSNRTLLPVRYISDLMNLKTEWDKVNRIATFSTEGIEIKVTIGSNIIYVNGEPLEMDTVAVIRNNRTFIPIRYLAEALNLELSWDPISKTIMIFND